MTFCVLGAVRYVRDGFLEVGKKLSRWYGDDDDDAIW